MVSDVQRRAYLAVARALRKGVLTRPTNCENCGSPSSHRGLDGHHHNGYEGEHALDVVWLCLPCHVVIHPNGRWHRGGTARWVDISPEERSDIQKNLWAGLSAEQREAQAQGIRDAWAKLTADERRTRTASQVEASRVKYTGAQRSSDMTTVWATLAPDERKARTSMAQGKCECGMISRRAPLASHAKAKGHTWEKI